MNSKKQLFDLLDAESISKEESPKSHASAETLLDSSPIASLPDAAGSSALPPKNTHSQEPLISLNPEMASHFLPSFTLLVGRILHDLSSHNQNLLKLNRSRREAIARYLNLISGDAGSTATKGEKQEDLRKFIESSQQPIRNALSQYFEEIALFYLSQTLLMKSWSDRNIRLWQPTDLKDVGWSFHSILASHLNIRETDGYQFMRRNIYSWYTPDETIQNEIFTALNNWNLKDVHRSFLLILVKKAQQLRSLWPEENGYDPRFFHALWNNLDIFRNLQFQNASLNPGPRYAFTPTLRDGSPFLQCPPVFQWYGMNQYPFQMYCAEFVSLWDQPRSPSVWAIGSGLDALNVSEPDLLPATDPSFSTLKRLQEMEACELALVIEEQSVRVQGRSANSLLFRQAIEQAPAAIKKLRSQASTLGDLQACVALDKLRPQGLLWWIREEPLSDLEGPQIHSFLLNRAKLLFEWNFSSLTHQLPNVSRLYPKYLYLFQREPRIENRNSNLPVRISLQGQIRSHIEIPLVLADAFEATLSIQGRDLFKPRGQWQIHLHQSPLPQSQWIESWPDQSRQEEHLLVERLKRNSVPLGQIATINKSLSRPLSLAPNQFEVFLTSISSLQKLQYKLETSTTLRNQKDHYYIITLPNEKSSAPIRAYLECDLVSKWLFYSVEKKNSQAVLSDQLLRLIPITQVFHGILDEIYRNECDFSFGVDWRAFREKALTDPKIALQDLTADPNWNANSTPLSATLFSQITMIRDHLFRQSEQILTAIGPGGQIRWSQLLQNLPTHECCSVTVHPEIKITGKISPHTPIAHIQRLKSHIPGIMLTLERGETLRLETENNLLFEIIDEQIQDSKYSTWSEILSRIKLPRQTAVLRSVANELIVIHAEKVKILDELSHQLANCTLL